MNLYPAFLFYIAWLLPAPSALRGRTLVPAALLSAGIVLHFKDKESEIILPKSKSLTTYLLDCSRTKTGECPERLKCSTRFFVTNISNSIKLRLCPHLYLQIIMQHYQCRNMSSCFLNTRHSLAFHLLRSHRHMESNRCCTKNRSKNN